MSTTRLSLMTLVSIIAAAPIALAEPSPKAPKAAPGDKTPAKAPAAKPADAAPAKKAEPEITLKVGDKAPTLEIDAWVKGEPVSAIESGKVYVVEFWATWCPPCRESIPHLTELQKKHKNDLTIIGVASSERLPRNAPKADPKTDAGGDKPDPRLSNLKKFVTDQGSKMEYRVAYDADRQMATGWMQPAGRNTIPTSFVVGHDGKIAWIGNPLEPAFDAAIEKAIKDAKAAGPGAKPAT